METIDYKNFLGVANINNGKKQIYAKVIDVDSNNSKALVETVDGSLRIKLNNKTGELLSVGDYVVVEYDKVLTKKNAYISLRNGQANPATKVNIENAIVIQEKVASYLLHEYTVVDYVAGNRIVYGGITNPVIINGYRAGKDISYDFDLYPEVKFASMVRSSTFYSDVTITLNINAFLSDGSVSFTAKSSALSGFSISETYTTKDMSKTGIKLIYERILPPEYIEPPEGQSIYGYVVCLIYIVYVSQSTGNLVYKVFDEHYQKLIGFTSQAEYNAAVGLISEPIPYSMYQINETITEV